MNSLAAQSIAHKWRGVFFEGPHPDQNRDGDEIPVWVVFVGDEEANPVSTVYHCHKFNPAEGLAKRMARDRRLFEHQQLGPSRQGKRQPHPLLLASRQAVHAPAAERLEAGGASAEVIDVRSLVPLDARTILDSVSRTGRLVTVEENPRLCGWGAEVASIVGFYSLYYDQPAGKYRVQVCTDLPCALRGAEKFLDELCENLGIRVGETTPDGMITVEYVMCLAGCDRAPMFQVQSGEGITYHENQTLESALKLVEELRQAGERRNGNERG